MKRRRKIYSFFTLVELMVSLVVFVILLGLMLQLFSGTQRMWTSMEKRNGVYADSRVAMDLLTRLLQGQVSSEEIPFHVNETDKKLEFFTKTPINLGGSQRSIRMVRIFPDSNNKLILEAINDGGGSNAGLEKLLRPINSGDVGDSFTLSNDLVGALSSTAASANWSNVVLLETMTDFSLKRLGNISDDTKAPEALFIQISLLDQKNYEIWNGMSSGSNKDLFRQQYEYTFSRVVFFDNITKSVE